MMPEDIADLKPLVISCLDDSSKKRPPAACISVTIKKVQEQCSKSYSYDGIDPIVWGLRIQATSKQNQQQSLPPPIQQQQPQEKQVSYTFH